MAARTKQAGKGKGKTKNGITKHGKPDMRLKKNRIKAHAAKKKPRRKRHEPARQTGDEITMPAVTSPEEAMRIARQQHAGGIPVDRGAGGLYRPLQTGEEVVAGEVRLSVVSEIDDVQIGGEHYKELPEEMQPWNVLQHWLTPEEYRGFVKGNAIIMLQRERTKNGTADVEKAAHWADKLVSVDKARASAD
jgi:hypothetical protein